MIDVQTEPVTGLPRAEVAGSMTLRNTGRPAGSSRLAGLVMAPLMLRAMRKDLARLKRLLEAR